MITDQIIANVEAAWPAVADTIGLDYEVTLGILPNGKPGLQFIFAANSPVIGERLFSQRPLLFPAALGWDDRALRQVLAEVAEQFIQIRAAVAAQIKAASPLMVPR